MVQFTQKLTKIKWKMLGIIIENNSIVCFLANFNSVSYRFSYFFVLYNLNFVVLFKYLASICNCLMLLGYTMTVNYKFASVCSSVLTSIQKINLNLTGSKAKMKHN